MVAGNSFFLLLLSLLLPKLLQPLLFDVVIALVVVGTRVGVTCRGCYEFVVAVDPGTQETESRIASTSYNHPTESTNDEHGGEKNGDSRHPVFPMELMLAS